MDKNLLEHLRKHKPSIDIQLDGCICRTHDYCHILGCSNGIHKITKLVTKANLSDSLVSNFKTRSLYLIIRGRTALCMEHYGALYLYPESVLIQPRCKCYNLPVHSDMVNIEVKIVIVI